MDAKTVVLEAMGRAGQALFRKELETQQEGLDALVNQTTTQSTQAQEEATALAAALRAELKTEVDKVTNGFANHSFTLDSLTHSLRFSATTTITIIQSAHIGGDGTFHENRPFEKGV